MIDALNAGLTLTLTITITLTLTLILGCVRVRCRVRGVSATIGTTPRACPPWDRRCARFMERGSITSCSRRLCLLWILIQSEFYHVFHIIYNTYHFFFIIINFCDPKKGFTTRTCIYFIFYIIIVLLLKRRVVYVCVCVCVINLELCFT